MKKVRDGSGNEPLICNHVLFPLCYPTFPAEAVILC